MNTFRELCETARAKDLKWILIGGHAVAWHGYGRMTEDVDFLICRDQKEDWHSVVESAGYRLIHDGGNFSQWEAPDESTDDLDFMIVNQSTFEKLGYASSDSDLEGIAMRVPKLEHLIALKLHALKGNRSLRVLKDMDDVIRLIEINKLNIQEPEFKAIALNYGGEELFAKLESILHNE